MFSRTYNSISDERAFCKILTEKANFMAVGAKSRGALCIEEYDFNWLVLKEIFYLVLFSRINNPLTATCTTEKLVAK